MARLRRPVLAQRETLKSKRAQTSQYMTPKHQSNTFGDSRRQCSKSPKHPRFRKRSGTIRHLWLLAPNEVFVLCTLLSSITHGDTADGDYHVIVAVCPSAHGTCRRHRRAKGEDRGWAIDGDESCSFLCDRDIVPILSESSLRKTVERQGQTHHRGRAEWCAILCSNV